MLAGAGLRRETLSDVQGSRTRSHNKLYFLRLYREFYLQADRTFSFFQLNFVFIIDSAPCLGITGGKPLVGSSAAFYLFFRIVNYDLPEGIGP
jgi:hypothetical protein